jgi:hypothetical protein
VKMRVLRRFRQLVAEHQSGSERPPAV